MLGINTVKNLALSTAVLGTLGKANQFQALNMDGFWRHSLCVGVTSKLIAKKRKTDPRFVEEYFIAGLLHDIGKIPLNNKLSAEYVTAMSLSDHDHLPLYASEKAAIGISHNEVGAMIVEVWKLDDAIRDAVSYHHEVNQYEGENRDILFTVALANYFANFFEIGFSGDRYPEKLSADIFSYLGVDMDYLEEIEDTVASEIDKARIFLKLA